MTDPVFVLNRAAPGALDLLLSRRSGSPKAMAAPGPSPAQLDVILTAAARVPDHGKLAPWRFVVFEGDARRAFGDVLAEALTQEAPEQATAERLETERKRFERAPVVIAVVSRVREGLPIPVWEQELSAGAVCMNLLLAAHASGFVAGWVTEWCAYSPGVGAALALGAGERIAGFVYIGTTAKVLEDRPRPPLETIVSRWQPAG